MNRWHELREILDNALDKMIEISFEIDNPEQAAYARHVTRLLLDVHGCVNRRVQETATT